MTRPKEGETKTCFVIAPIGTEGSDVRLRADQVQKHIIAPAARECGYEAIRADQISEPGLITSQVIQHVVEDPLVVADLTGRNPNVFYELALRHALKRPVVQIIHATEPIPFDVAATRTIHVDHHDLDSAAKAKDEIIKQIRAVERNPAEVDTPISVAIELQQLRQSDNPLEKSNAEIISMLQELRTGVVELRDLSQRRPYLHPGIVQELMLFFDRFNSLLAFEEGKTVSIDDVEQLRMHLRHSERLMDHLCMEAGIPPSAFRRRSRTRDPAMISK